MQAVPNKGDYQPLIVVNGVPSWPSEPLYGQLENSGVLEGQDLESYWNAHPPVKKIIFAPRRAI